MKKVLLAAKKLLRLHQPRKQRPRLIKENSKQTSIAAMKKINRRMYPPNHLLLSELLLPCIVSSMVLPLVFSTN